jgi:hypothetical protein
MRTIDINLEQAQTAWSPSHREELLSAAWFMVAGIFHLCGCSPWIVYFIGAKAGLDSICAVVLSIKEIKEELANEEKNNE